MTPTKPINGETSRLVREWAVCAVLAFWLAGLTGFAQPATTLAWLALLGLVRADRAARGFETTGGEVLTTWSFPYLAVPAWVLWSRGPLRGGLMLLLAAWFFVASMAAVSLLGFALTLLAAQLG